MKKPKNYSITTGKATASNKLNALDKALLKAKIGNYNLIQVSSIIPNNSKYKKEPPKKESGTLLPCVLSKKVSKKENELISSSIAVAEGNEIKVIAEETNNTNKKQTQEKAKQKAKKMLKIRNQEIKEIKSSSIQKRTKKTSAVIAAVILW